MKFNIKVKKIHEDACIPSFANEGDAGADLFSIENVVISPKDVKLIKTGIAIELPKNTEAQIRSRSGLALKKKVFVLNSPGTIDEGYRGEIGIILANFSDEDFCVDKGDKIAQMVVKPIYNTTYEVVSDLSDTQRGEGGFGSTGLKK